MNNQYVSITPNVLNLTEFVSFEQTFTIDYVVPEPEDPLVPITPTPPETYDYVYHDVTYDYSQISKLSSLNIVRLSDTSFKISGVFSDIFDRILKYANTDASLGVNNHFGDLPENYAALYSYTPPSETTKIITFNVLTRPISGPSVNPPENTLHTYTVTAIIALNLPISNEYFRKALETGSYYKRAVEAGKI